MSITLVEEEILRFLRSPEPEVICIRGKWGVGKTYSWNAFLSRARKSDSIAMQSYAYVSLFGLGSLDQVKYAVFENAIATKDIGIEPSVETFKENTLAVSKRLGKKSLSILDKLPRAKDYAAALQSLSFLSIQKMIVCIDDLERKGQHLPMKDVMGLISHLREQKKCKVVLILNQDSLVQKDKEDFDRYNEKVIDVSLQFQPEATECARIAITGENEVLDFLRDDVIALGISNIRIIKKIERLVLRIAPLIEKLNPQVLRQAVQSLTLLGWSAFSEGDAPSSDYILHKHGRGFYGLRNNEDVPEQERDWENVLSAYGFVRSDEFDLELANSIERGYFDQSELMKQARNLHNAFESVDAEGSQRAAWSLYHDSFEENEDELVTAIIDAIRDNVQFVSPMNLNGAMRLLRDLDRGQQATEMLEYYLQNRQGDREFYDLQRYPFSEDIDDPELLAAFDEKYVSFQDDRPPMEVLAKIGKEQTWSRDDLTLLSNLSANDFYTHFKNGSGSELSRAIEAVLRFGSTVNADQLMTEISSRAREALVRIGQESRLNARRVQNKYGIRLDV